MSSSLVNGCEAFMLMPPFAQAKQVNATVRTAIAAPNDMR